MELTAYRIGDLRIRPAPQQRDWMDATGYAYRCLPLNIANSCGWELLCAEPVEATWDGGKGLDAMHVWGGAAKSHFGHGILTFHVFGLITVSEGYDLYVTGPVNRPKDGITALTGVVEARGVSFTMNWQFTRPCTVRFDENEPFACIFPVMRLDDVQPMMRSLDDNPELAEQHRAWSRSRSQFNSDLKVPRSDAVQRGWQKDYFRAADRSKLRLKPFQVDE